ncbi:ABC transporter permease [Nakamurella antarctica]|uniref:ABC transporter permease n=2 Tax=Nakamurella antarctica TaxID=1902245 RepID=A0A3G8ZRF8_9ACTN|nr:ABC transporter permease [Nakamurella antarctica]
MTTLASQDQSLVRMEDGPSDLGGPVAAQTEFRLVFKRFVRHKAAMIALVVLVLIVITAFSSIGFGPIGGWWKHKYTTFEPALTDGGKPTLKVWPPSLGDHPFGQDSSGRDYFAMTMRGMQQSIIIAFIVGIVATVVGTVIGALAGYFRGWIEAVLMRMTDVIITIPLLAVAAVVGHKVSGSSIVFLGLFLGLLTWTGLARIVRGEFLSLREKEFVDAARSVGASSRRIIFRHILPNTIGVITVSATLAISGAILLETALSFLSFGVQSPDTSLGLLLEQNRQAMDVRPYLFWWPGLFIVAISLAINFVGDGLRDAFDPRQIRSKA